MKLNDFINESGRTIRVDNNRPLFDLKDCTPSGVGSFKVALNAHLEKTGGVLEAEASEEDTDFKTGDKVKTSVGTVKFTIGKRKVQHAPVFNVRTGKAFGGRSHEEWDYLVRMPSKENASAGSSDDVMKGLGLK